MDGAAKIFKENRTVQDTASLAEMAVTEFRVRCFQPLCHLSAGPKRLSVAALYLAAAQVIEELIQFAKDIRVARSRGEESGPADDVPNMASRSATP